MRTLPADRLDDIWDEYWAGLASQWFKLEVLQDYSREDDSSSLRAWLAGDRQKSLELLKTDDDPLFTADCRQKIAQGVDLIRIHAIKEPLSPYMQWEMEYYKRVSQPLRGEKVYVIDARQTSDLNMPEGDLILFDQSRAIVNSYSRAGYVSAAQVYDKHDDLSQFLALKNRLLERAKRL